MWARTKVKTPAPASSYRRGDVPQNPGKGAGLADEWRMRTVQRVHLRGIAHRAIDRFDHVILPGKRKPSVNSSSSSIFTPDWNVVMSNMVCPPPRPNAKCRTLILTGVPAMAAST